MRIGPHRLYREKLKLPFEQLTVYPVCAFAPADGIPQAQASDAVAALFLRMAEASGLPRREIL
jgi:hypothetical protein